MENFGFGSFNIAHPELQDGEVFLGNFTRAQAHSVGWKSKRIGHQSYDTHGTRYDGASPVFVQRSELPTEVADALQNKGPK